MGARVSAILALPSPESLNAAAMTSSAADDAGLAPAVEGGDLVTKFVTTGDQKSAEQVSPDGMELTPFGVITVGCTIAAAATTRECKPLWQNEFGVSCQDVTPIAASMRGGEEKVHPTGLEPVTFGSVDRSPFSGMLASKVFAAQGFRQKQHSLTAFQISHISVPSVPFYKRSVPTSVAHYAVNRRHEKYRYKS